MVAGLARLFPLLLLVGCASGPDYRGTWEGKQDVPDAPAHIAGTVGRVKLEILPEGRFRFTRMSMPWEGRYRLAEGELVLEVETALGRPVTEPMTTRLKPGKDCTLVLEDAFSVAGSPVVLRRTSR